MLQNFWRISFATLGILIALVILLAYATQAANIQIIPLQPVYAVLDRRWMEIRILFYLLVVAVGCAKLLIRRSGAVKDGGESRIPPPHLGKGGKGDSSIHLISSSLRTAGSFLALVVIGGLILGLLVFYGHSCCDSPVFIMAGFPFSWLRGMTPADHYLPLPIVPYLMQNLSAIRWTVDGFSLAVNLLVWINLGIIASTRRRTS